MASLTLDSQTSLLDGLAPARECAPADVDAAVAGPSLDEVVTRAWSALRVSRSAACLLCGGEVAPRYGSGPHPVGGSCRSCGTAIG